MGMFQRFPGGQQKHFYCSLLQGLGHVTMTSELKTESVITLFSFILLPCLEATGRNTLIGRSRFPPNLYEVNSQPFP